MTKYHRLKVLDEKRERGRMYFICKCDCGTVKNIRKDSVISGRAKSCGCLKKELVTERIVKMSTTHGMRRTRFYRTWQNMKNRCLNEKVPEYKEYGGRGITICKKWEKFEGFKEDMHSSYLKHVEKHGSNQTSIERIDNSKGYNLENCRWATNTEQNINQRIRRDNTSGIKGVSWHEPNKKWRARISINRKTIFLGYFESKEEAGRVRKDAERKYFNKIIDDSREEATK